MLLVLIKTLIMIAILKKPLQRKNVMPIQNLNRQNMVHHDSEYAPCWKEIGLLVIIIVVFFIPLFWHILNYGIN